MTVQAGVTNAKLSRGRRVISIFLSMRLSYRFTAFPLSIGW